MAADTLIVVLIKDFDTAKRRLEPQLTPAERRRLARRTARRALRAACAVAPTLAVCGSGAAATLAAAEGATTILESEPRGQNPAAERGIREAADRGAGTVLLLSSDLPLVTADSLHSMLQSAPAGEAVVVAAAAMGREGTNALMLRPPEGVHLHFGDRSLPAFAAEAARCGRPFITLSDQRLALDLDEPADLGTWLELRGSA